MKYIDNKLFIFSREREKFFSVPLGVNARSAFLNNRLSFIKKKEMNKIENKPTLKDPKAPTMEFNTLGIDFKLAINILNDEG